ncbi:MAG: Schlafen-like putative transcriptional regulator containing HTH and ATP-binding domain [Candidatus Methanohalarchaeum thermophilum]|uniref:Schlafen-like putative transcriptional regulator containing HTH and ATP-binding domain n=1 Tax=Methanohalarchaeum thermophilum TaxID=1903181 RepID=A0A1Q6DV37_METT1|nr:MAG: Schlafen-like putative transcriptional regulator containing HTH and ATP-binding domain [Candidatus Methanohalarchaeum thermophilum]
MSPQEETETFDAKRKGILKSSKLAKTASAMANKNGGTIVIGIGVDHNGCEIIKGFSNKPEEKNRAKEIIKDNTRPSMVDLFKVRFSEVRGVHLLRIDISKSVDEMEEPVKYTGGSSPKAYIRNDDSSDPMTKRQINKWHKKRKRKITNRKFFKFLNKLREFDKNGYPSPDLISNPDDQKDY